MCECVFVSVSVCVATRRFVTVLLCNVFANLSVDACRSFVSG